MVPYLGISLLSAVAGLLLGHWGRYGENLSLDQIEFGLMVLSVPAVMVAVLQLPVTIVACHCSQNRMVVLGTLAVLFYGLEFWMGCNIWRFTDF